jgi:hypothetical protein
MEDSVKGVLLVILPILNNSFANLSLKESSHVYCINVDCALLVQHAGIIMEISISRITTNIKEKYVSNTLKGIAKKDNFVFLFMISQKKSVKICRINRRLCLLLKKINKSRNYRVQN